MYVTRLKRDFCPANVPVSYPGVQVQGYICNTMEKEGRLYPSGNCDIGIRYLNPNTMVSFVLLYTILCVHVGQLSCTLGYEVKNVC